jgi:ribulose-5-phosphate 4-epimerase/fuculose-1-phosphate aldolase
MVRPSVRSLLPELTARDELALLARVLAREGYGHRPDGLLVRSMGDGSWWCIPVGITWSEVRPEHLVLVDRHGTRLEGTWPVPERAGDVIEITSSRPQIALALLDASPFGALWIDLGALPPPMDQSSSAGGGDLRWAELPDEAAAVADCGLAFVPGRGVAIAGSAARAVHERAIALETRCRRAWQIRAVGAPLDTVLPEQYLAWRRTLDGNRFVGLWEAMARLELRADPSLLVGAGPSE